jgi:simple sugar transport system permease protein
VRADIPRRGKDADVGTADADTPPAPRIREHHVTLTAALLVLALGSLLILAFGQSPLRVWGAMLSRTVGDPYAIGQVLFKATALCFTGLAVALALDARLFNVGVEGQMVAGTLACALAGHALPAGTPAVLAVTACVTAAALAGGAIGAATGALRAYRGAHEVITGIMLNAIIAGGVLWLGNAVLFEGGTTRGAPIIAAAELPHLGLGGSAASGAVFLALAAAAVVWALRARSHWGARWRAVGASAGAAENLGIPVRRTQVWIMAASGALAGLAATGFVLGHQHGFEEGMNRGFGFMGIAVGLLGRGHPLGVAAAAVVVGFLSHGGLEVGDLVPKELTELLLGVAVIAVAVAAPLVHRLGGRR